MKASALAPSLLALAGITASFALAFQSEAPLGKIEGQLRLTSGAPAAKARVVLIPNGEGAWRRARSDEKGAFAFANVPTGAYRVVAESRANPLRRLFRAEIAVRVGEAQSAAPALQLRRVLPSLPSAPPLRDPERVRRRALDIINARFMLTRELLQIIRANDRSGMPLPVVLAQAGAESSFRPQWQGALDEIGLFQLRPVTAQDQINQPLNPAQLLDPAFNTRLATTYMGRLREYFGSTRVALAAYNQGPGRTRREGLHPLAQIYADAILAAAYHAKFRERVLELDPSLASHWKDGPNAARKK